MYSHAEVKMPSAPVAQEEAVIRLDYKETAPRQEERLTPIHLQSPLRRVLGQNRRVSSAGKNQNKGSAFYPCHFFFLDALKAATAPLKATMGGVRETWLVRWGLGTDRPYHETLQVRALAGILQHGTGQKK